MRVYLDNCCYNRPFDDQAQLKVRLGTDGDYTAWRERNLRVDESVHDVAERARAASRKFDEMHGDYTKWRAEHIDNPNETLEELAAKAKEAGEIVRLRERVLDMGDARRPKARSAKKKESSRHRRAAPAVPAQT